MVCTMNGKIHAECAQIGESWGNRQRSAVTEVERVPAGESGLPRMPPAGVGERDPEIHKRRQKLHKLKSADCEKHITR